LEMTGSVTPAATTSGTGDSISASFSIIHEFPSSAVEAAWRDCLRRVHLPAHYNAPEYFHSPLWKGKRPFAILAMQGSRVVGILTGLHEGKNLNCGLQSRPQICIDGTVERAQVERALATGFLQEADNESLLNVYSWTLLDSFRSLGFRHRQLEGDIILDLTLGPDALFKQSHMTRRRNIRFAMRNGVEASPTEAPDDFREYYDVYLRWYSTQRKKIKGKPLPWETFLESRALTGNSCLFVARYKGRIVAGDIVRFFPGGLAEASANSSLDEFLHLKPNDLLLWTLIEWCCKQGLRHLSMGGGHSFLKHCGGVLVPVHRYRMDRTWLRRHDLEEAARNWGRKKLSHIPQPVERTIRRLLRRG
jgi:hypothetical protein